MPESTDAERPGGTDLAVIESFFPGLLSEVGSQLREIFPEGRELEFKPDELMTAVAESVFTKAATLASLQDQTEQFTSGVAQLVVHRLFEVSYQRGIGTEA